MQERMTLSNMSAELGAQVGLIAPDEGRRSGRATVARARPSPGVVHATPGPRGCSTCQRGDAFPQVAAPHSPANTGAVEATGGTAVDDAYIGACTGAELEDLRTAAQILRGPQVASRRGPGGRAGERVAPGGGGGGRDAGQALTGAGAILLPTGCGACAGFGAGMPGQREETCISSTARNYKGRMGAGSARVYLGSPYTVAASAVAGRIADPRAYLQ